MNYWKLLFVLLLPLLHVSIVRSQQTVNPSGGNAEASAGSLSFSVGEVFFETGTQDEITFADGVQQAYDFPVVTGVEIGQQNTSISIFPNPHSDFVMIAFNNKSWGGNFTYRLTDTGGRLLLSSAITGAFTTVDTSALPEAIYFLEVISQVANGSTDIFKIIKTK